MSFTTLNPFQYARPTTSQAPQSQPYGYNYAPNPEPEQKPGLMDLLAQSLGTGAGEGFAGGLQQQLKRSALDKMLNNLNPNMNTRDRLGFILNADPEHQKAIQETFKQHDAQRVAEQKQRAQQEQAQAFNQALQGYNTQPQQGQSQGQQGQVAQPTAETQPGQVNGAGITDPRYQDMLLRAKQHREDQEQKAQQHQQNQEFQRKQKQIESEEKISLPIMQDVEAKRASIPTLQNALKVQKQAIEEDDLSAFSPDNLADITGWEGFRTGSGALFKTAGKEFFLGSINQVGKQPNQWIEQQIFSMAPQIGRNREANLKVNSLLKFKADADELDVQTKTKLAEDLRKELGFVPSNIGALAYEIERPLLEKKEKQLGYDLQRIHEQENPDELKKMRVVRKGTPLTREKAQAMKLFTGGDVDKARKLAVKLGYEIPDADVAPQGNN